MGRPRKYDRVTGAPIEPEEQVRGKHLDTWVAEFERNKHVAKLGDRRYLRIPQVDDVEIRESENPYFLRAGIPCNQKVYEVFKGINDMMADLCGKYLELLDIKELISKYMNPTDETEYNENRRCEVSAKDMETLSRIFEESKRDTFFVNDINRVMSQIYAITVIKPNTLPVTDVYSQLQEVE